MSNDLRRNSYKYSLLIKVNDRVRREQVCNRATEKQPYPSEASEMREASEMNSLASASPGPSMTCTLKVSGGDCKNPDQASSIILPHCPKRLGTGARNSIRLGGYSINAGNARWTILAVSYEEGILALFYLVRCSDTEMIEMKVDV